MVTTDVDTVDLSTKTIRAYFDAPISVTFDAESLTLFIDNASVPSHFSRLNVQAVFTTQAIHQLLSSLKQIEEALKEKEAKTTNNTQTNFLDQSNLL